MKHALLMYATTSREKKSNEGLQLDCEVGDAGYDTRPQIKPQHRGLQGLGDRVIPAQGLRRPKIASHDQS
jgi:hypothetical protein